MATPGAARNETSIPGLAGRTPVLEAKFHLDTGLRTIMRASPHCRDLPQKNGIGCFVANGLSAELAFAAVLVGADDAMQYCVVFAHGILALGELHTRANARNLHATSQESQRVRKSSLCLAGTRVTV